MPEVMSIEVDEEFDPRPPSSPFGLRGPDGELNYGLIGGIALAVVLVLLLIFVVIKPFSTGPKAAKIPDWKPNDPTLKIDFLEAYAANSEMVQSVQTSLDSWAHFYTTGKLEDLAQSFDLTGEQFAKLSEDQPSIAAAPEAGLPAVVELGPVGDVERNGNIFTVRVVVSWKKPGAAEGQVFKWDIDMKSSKQTYVLRTVRETDTTEKQPIDFCGAIGVVAGLDDSETISAEFKKLSGSQKLKAVKDLFPIRLKAWSLLETSVAGSDSENDVRAIVEENQKLTDATKEETDVSKILGIQGKVDISKERESIESRASVECGEDISKR